MMEWERTVDDALLRPQAVLIQYLIEKSNMGVVDIRALQTADPGEVSANFAIAVAAYFEVILPEMYILCLDRGVHMKADINRKLRKEEAQVGSSGITSTWIEGVQIFRKWHRPTKFCKDDTLLITLRLWDLPYFSVRRRMGEGGQTNFIEWTDKWWEFGN